MCEGIARCTLVVFNILFLIFGVVCLGVGIWVKVGKASLIDIFRIATEETNVDTKDYDVPSLLESGAYILIAVGALVFVIAFFGFCGAAKKSKCCLVIYGALVLLILVIQVAAGILVAVYKGDFENSAFKVLNTALEKKYDGPYKQDNFVSLTFDKIQTSQQCCGINGTGDFAGWTNWNRTWMGANDAKIPFTCCPSKNPDSYPEEMKKYYNNLKDPNCPKTEGGSFNEGCYNKIKDLLSHYYTVILGSAVGVALVQLILVIIACCIACRNKDDFE